MQRRPSSRRVGAAFRSTSSMCRTNAISMSPRLSTEPPLTVAVSTEGDAPVLARLVLARIEAMLAPELGRVARLAGLAQGTGCEPAGQTQQRRFYEELLSGDVRSPDVVLAAHLAHEAAWFG